MWQTPRYANLDSLLLSAIDRKSLHPMAINIFVLTRCGQQQLCPLATLHSTWARPRLRSLRAARPGQQEDMCTDGAWELPPLQEQSTSSV